MAKSHWAWCRHQNKSALGSVVFSRTCFCQPKTTSNVFPSTSSSKQSGFKQNEAWWSLITNQTKLSPKPDWFDCWLKHETVSKWWHEKWNQSHSAAEINWLEFMWKLDGGRLNGIWMTKAILLAMIVETILISSLDYFYHERNALKV